MGRENVPNGILDRLSEGGRTGVFLGALVVVLAGFFLPGWLGAILLVSIVAGFGWLMSQTWRVAAPQTRTIRVLVLLVLVAVAVYKIKP
jgi:membrane protein DedA with SNARE-associated domain